MTDPADLRRGYRRGHLDERDVAATWLEQLQNWFGAAAADPNVLEPNAIQLATVDADGCPAVRTVLAKAIDNRGVVFYTNHDSAKGRALRANPRAAIVFAWLAQERQVRLAGAITQVERIETERYFATRPRESQIGAWASPQSEVVSSRAELDAAEAATATRFEGQQIPAPPYWGGYLLRPHAVEFWQGRRGRLHDRIRFRQDGDVWIRERLAP
ncbi:MAG: pyridoxamine 5'-phosphate oxidase [Jatrophihabitans sp.]